MRGCVFVGLAGPGAAGNLRLCAVGFDVARRSRVWSLTSLQRNSCSIRSIAAWLRRFCYDEYSKDEESQNNNQKDIPASKLRLGSQRRRNETPSRRTISLSLQADVAVFVPNSHKRAACGSLVTLPYITLDESRCDMVAAWQRSQFFSFLFRSPDSRGETFLGYHGQPMKKLLGVLFLVCLSAKAQAPTALPAPDERYKVDLLLVVAHPDDEAAATPYLARIQDEGKRVAVVFTTRGSSGANQAGNEQAAALGDIREIEARNALATLGVTNVWFISGKDTASQNVLQSLANWGHAACLEQMVRIVRLTRPEVILTVLPGTFIGENHGDHQATGVVATEAFDLAGDPTVFPEQVSGPTKRLEPLLENLRPWQPKKIYYFPDARSEDLFRGKGPEYSVKELSKSTKQPYWRMALDSFRAHQTQAKPYLDKLAQMDDAQIEKLATSDNGWAESQKFVFGRSLVGGGVTADIFEGITPGAIPFARPEIVPAPSKPDLSVELAGPWSFYSDFYRAHGLTNLPHPEPPEIALQAHGTLIIPLWLRNQTAKPQEITLTAKLPDGWTVQDGTGKFTVRAKQVAAGRVEVYLPPPAENAPRKSEPQEVFVRAEANGHAIGEVKLRVELRTTRTLPQ